MKIKELIRRLRDFDGDAIAVIHEKGLPYDFTGLNMDDNGDADMYVCSGDKAL